jgi:uncharacterized damage-inducible protein DinB
MAQTPEEISKLFAYTWWANARVLALVAPLSAEEFGRQLGGSFPSVRETLAHIYSADWIWHERWQGRSPEGLPPSEQAPTLEALREKWAAVEAKQRSFLAGLTQARLNETISYRSVKGDPFGHALGDLFVHLVNHSTYHRGQAVTMLRQLGKAALTTDYLVFLRENGA